MTRQSLVVAGAALLIAFPSTLSAVEGQKPLEPPSSARNPIYTCPMHPQIQWSRPDKCPICDMTLVVKGAKKSPVVTDEMPDHSGMSMDHEGVHDGHGGMPMMGCGCSMCMEMMG